MATVRYTEAQFNKFNSKRGTNNPIYKENAKTFYKETTALIVTTNKIVSKPRMTRGSTYKIKTDKHLKEYWNWVDEIKWKYKSNKGKLYVQPVALGFEFHIPLTTRRDLDNMIKGIKDALKRLAFPDDCVQWVRAYDYVRVVPIQKGMIERMELMIRPILDMVTQ